jgi:hypothetical protein
VAVTAVVSILIAGAILVSVGYAGFLAGRDSAEREAGRTIADLRRRCMALRSQRDRALEASARNARILGTLPPVVIPEPSWMRDDA